MSYTTIQDGTLRLELTVLGLLIIAFLLAVVLMFVHPTGALTVFAFSLVGTIVFAGFDRRRRRTALRLACDALAHESCPRCDGPVTASADDDGDRRMRCQRCGMSYASSGHELG